VITAALARKSTSTVSQVPPRYSARAQNYRHSAARCVLLGKLDCGPALRYSARLRAKLNRYTAKNWNAEITRGPIDFPESCCNKPTPASSNWMKPANVPNISNADRDCLQIAIKTMKASGMVRAAAYIAKMNAASVGTQPVGNIEFGRTSPAIENPDATKTLIAVTTETSRMGADRAESCVMRKSIWDRHPAADVGFTVSGGLNRCSGSGESASCLLLAAPEAIGIRPSVVRAAYASGIAFTPRASREVCLTCRSKARSGP
jgi:hypothetical protein